MFTEQSNWQRKKDDIILKRIEAEPTREKELLAWSDKADKLILKVRQHNEETHNGGKRK